MKMAKNSAIFINRQLKKDKQMHPLKTMTLTATLSLFSLSLYAIKLNITSPQPPSTQKSSLENHPQMPMTMPPNISINAKSWVLMDYNSGQILAEKNPNEHLPVASLNKLMTSYVSSQAIQHNIAHLDDQILITKKASTTPGSKMFINTGHKISLENLMKGMIIQSGNDASVAIAEHIAGTESAFAHMMNQTARQLGLKDSHFANPTGLPANNQYSSAYDLALLSRALIAHFPTEYQWYKLKSFTWNNITQKNRNSLLWHDTDIDGLKTGYTRKAKYCFVGSGQKDGMRLIVTVLGAPSVPSRMADAKRLLTYGFRFYETHLLYAGNQVIKTFNTQDLDGLSIGSNHDVYVTVPKGHYQNLAVHAIINPELKAPVKKGQAVGKIEISLKGKTLDTLPLIALKDVSKRGVFSRLLSWFRSSSSAL